MKKKSSYKTSKLFISIGFVNYFLQSNLKHISRCVMSRSIIFYLLDVHFGMDFRRCKCVRELFVTKINLIFLMRSIAIKGNCLTSRSIDSSIEIRSWCRWECEWVESIGEKIADVLNNQVNCHCWRRAKTIIFSFFDWFQKILQFL